VKRKRHTPQPRNHDAGHAMRCVSGVNPNGTPSDKLKGEEL